jgi:hypothetical protein
MQCSKVDKTQEFALDLFLKRKHQKLEVNDTKIQNSFSLSPYNDVFFFLPLPIMIENFKKY